MKPLFLVAAILPAVLLLSACGQSETTVPEELPSDSSSAAPGVDRENVEGLMPEVPVLPDAPTGE